MKKAVLSEQFIKTAKRDEGEEEQRLCLDNINAPYKTCYKREDHETIPKLLTEMLSGEQQEEKGNTRTERERYVALQGEDSEK